MGGSDGETRGPTAGRSRARITRAAEVPVGGAVWPRIRLTRAGTGFALMLLVLGIVAANPGLNLMLLLFGLGVGLLLFNAIAAKRQIGAVGVRRILPDVAAAGRPTILRYEITNRSSWTAVRGLWIVDDPGEGWTDPAALVSLIDEIPAGGTSRVEVHVVPLRRGVLALGALRLASKFPFGLVKRLRNVRRPDQLLVWPALWRPRNEWLSRTPRAAQTNLSRNGAWHPGSDEFFGIREYRPGDNTRLIHWRRSASFDRMLVREMAETSPGHVTLALETVTSAGPAETAALDEMVSAAASLACDALERGWHVGLILNGRPRVVLPPAGGHAVRSRLLYELARLEAAQGERLSELLRSWPGGSGWTGRAVLLHPNSNNNDAQIASIAGHLAAQIGPVAVLGPADLDRWFDRSSVTVCVPKAAVLGVESGKGGENGTGDASAEHAVPGAPDAGGRP